MRFGKISTFIFLTLTILLLASFCYAERPLESPLPGMEGTTTPLLPDYIKYIFNFAIGIAGLIAFGCLVYGGFRYLISAGNPTTMADANDQIFSGVIGLIVILGSWLLLTTINPQLVVLSPDYKPSELEVGEAPGVYLCKDAAGKECQLFTQNSDDLGGFNNQEPLYVKFQDFEGVEYGAVLHEDKYYEGDCAVCLGEGAGCQSDIAKLGGDGASSITVFFQGGGGGSGGATVYRYRDYNQGEDETKNYYRFTIGNYPILDNYVFKGTNCDIDGEVSSIKVEDGSMALLFDNREYGGQCSVFFGDDPWLGNDAIGNDQASSLKVLPARK